MDMRHQVLLLLLLSWPALQLGCSDRQAHSRGLPGESEPVPVTVTTVRYEKVPLILDAPGIVQASHRISLSSQINGFVREMHVREGDIVRTGQLLVSLDAREPESQKAAAQAAVEEAQAALTEAQKGHEAAVETRSATKAAARLAEQTYVRYQKLLESKSVSLQEMDEVAARRLASAAELASRESMVAAAEGRIRQVEAKLEQARAQLLRAEVVMSWTRIKAPESGRIVERSADAGTAVFPGNPLVAIESIGNPQALADLPTAHAGSLRIGMNLCVRSADSAACCEGRVSEIVPVSNPATHSVQFKLDLPAGFALPSGHFVKVEVPVGDREAVLVPHRAVRTTGQLAGVFVVDDGSRARFRLVKTASYDSDRAEVLSGVEAGEDIIMNLSRHVVDGIHVAARH